MSRIVALDVHDVRFPTSDELHGSDAMHPDPDYSAAYAILRCEDVDGHGLSFTIGRGTEVVCAAIRALRPLVVGMDLDDVMADLGAFWRRLTSDGQLRWLGPEKGAIHLATSAIVNAIWDAMARRAGQPLWQYLSKLSPEQVVSAIDFRYITDAITKDEAIDLLRRARHGIEDRRAGILTRGYPSYTTSPGWIGYDDDQIAQRTREAAQAGWTHVKMKVGSDRSADVRRARVIREALGPDGVLMMDANQVWDVDQAIEWMRPLAEFDPYWIEEPTSPDDVLGHARIAKAVAPVRVATGEHCANRVMFKQLMQAEAIGVCQIDACRLGGVNEVIAVLLMAAKFDIPVCPHAGGVGLCEMVQHFSIFDYLCVSGSLQGRFIEHSAHLHEHFTDPITMSGGRYAAPSAAGFSTRMRSESIAEYAFPDGPVWRARR